MITSPESQEETPNLDAFGLLKELSLESSNSAHERLFKSLLAWQWEVTGC